MFIAVVDETFATNTTTAAAVGSTFQGSEVVAEPPDSMAAVPKDALPPAPLIDTAHHEAATGLYSDDSDSAGDFEDQMAEECARLHCSSPLVRWSFLLLLLLMVLLLSTCCELS